MGNERGGGLLWVPMDFAAFFFGGENPNGPAHRVHQALNIGGPASHRAVGRGPSLPPGLDLTAHREGMEREHTLERCKCMMKCARGEMLMLMMLIGMMRMIW